MEITKRRLMAIIREELESDLMPQPLDPSAKNPTFTKPPKTKGEPTVQDLMFKMEKLMARIERVEKALSVKPSHTEEDSYGDTDYADLPDRT